MSITLLQGDCLELLKTLPDNSVDAVVTDPPYCSGARTSADISNRKGMSRGAKWNAKPLDNDRMTTTGFIWLLREVAFEVERILKPKGSFLCFIDWRQYPHAYGAIESANLRIQGMVVWDKMNMALGNGFRNQHELIIHAAKGVPAIYNRSVPNVLREARISSSTIHPTEKPVALMERLLAVTSPPGGVVVDAFMGSGPVGIACVNTGRCFIGIERDPEYFKVAQNRIARAQEAHQLTFEATA